MTIPELIAWAEKHIEDKLEMVKSNNHQIKLDACSTVLDQKEFLKTQLGIIKLGENVAYRGRQIKNIYYPLAIERLLKYQKSVLKTEK